MKKYFEIILVFIVKLIISASLFFKLWYTVQVLNDFVVAVLEEHQI